MATASKTFKIGEYCKGGIITAEVKNNRATIIGKEWDMNTGTRKSSDQSNAQEFTRQEFSTGEYRQMLDFLCDLTTSYYADKVAEWVKSKMKFENSFW